MPLAPGHKTNLNTIIRAAKAGHLAVLECKRRSDGAIVPLLVTVSWDGREYTMTPFAEMVQGNPFELYLPPDPNNKTGFIETREGEEGPYGCHSNQEDANE